MCLARQIQRCVSSPRIEMCKKKRNRITTSRLDCCKADTSKTQQGETWSNSLTRARTERGKAKLAQPPSEGQAWLCLRGGGQMGANTIRPEREKCKWYYNQDEITFIRKHSNLWKLHTQTLQIMFRASWYSEASCRRAAASRSCRGQITAAPNTKTEDLLASRWPTEALILEILCHQKPERTFFSHQDKKRKWK